MAVAFDAVTPDTASGAGTSTLTSGSWTIAGSDRLLIGIIATGDTAAAGHSGMDHPAAGGALTQIGSTLALGVHGNLSAWRLIAPAASSNTTKGTWASSQGEATIAGVSYTGVDQTTPINISSIATATGQCDGSGVGTATVNVTTSPGDLVFAAVWQHNQSAATAPLVAPAGGSTGRYETEGAQIGSYGALQCIELVASGTTTTMSVDITSADATPFGNWGIIAFVVNAASTATADQEGARFGNDDGAESAFTFAAAQDANITHPLATNLLFRALVDGTGDLANVAYTLRAQKNGAGGYTAVPVGAGSEVTPPQVTSATVASVTTAADPWSLTSGRPAAASGDMVVVVIAWDDTTAVTSVTPPAGANSEAAVSIAGPVASNSTEMRLQAWYYITTGSWSNATWSWDPSAAETCRQCAFVIPAGQFSPSDPIGFASTTASAGTAESNINSPTGTAEADDGNGRLFIAFGSDADAITAPASGTTTVDNGTTGGVGLCVVSRNAAVSDSESIAAITATITSDSWATVAFVVKPATVTNEIYVATSANITAGGEATTARLAAPSGKTTGDFVTGRRWDDENGSDSIDITTDDYTELEWCLLAQSPAVNGDYFDLRVYAGGSALNSYSVTPRWTLGSAAASELPALTMAPMFAAGRR